MTEPDPTPAESPDREAAPPLVSIVTAVFNSAKTVSECIGSVAAQDYPRLEHVVVDGQSTDGSLEEIRRAAHSRMRMVSEPDEGIYDALNKGVRLSSGEVIGFVHADDFLAHRQVLTRIAAQFYDPTVDAVFADLDYVSQLDSSRVVRRWSTGHFEPRRLKYGWMPAHPTLYLRRRVYDRLGGFDQSYRIAADYDFILRCFGGEAVTSRYIPEVLYKMRLGGASNKDWPRIRRKMHEDLRAIRRHKVGGLFTLACKNLSKLSQFVAR
jgi:glycosyltransferase involved in cell wall biosynthesis